MKQLRTTGSLALCAALVSAFLAACGGGPRSVDVTMTDYQMVLSVPSISAGEVTFHITNNADSTVHEFVVVQTDTLATALPVGEDLLVDESQFTPVDEVEDLAAGASADLTVTLTAGHYVLLCNLPAHFTLGMHTDFTVTP